MSSVFDGLNLDWDRVVLADTIVTSVFMGLVRERLVGGFQVFIGYGGGFDVYQGSQTPNQGKAISEEDREQHDQLDRRLREIFSAYANKLVIGPSNKWVDASKGGRQHVPTSSYVITGAQSAKQIHKAMSTRAQLLAVDCLNSNNYRGTWSKERGAYYGVADLNNGEVYGPIATTRQIYWSESGRWMTPGQGWIRAPGQLVADGSNARMSDTADERLISNGLYTKQDWQYVVGYCHGMIFAEHICKVAGGGTAYEISMNEQTCKNASCFGCSTFMFANGMPPSWMHLGSAESWSPLPEDADNFAYTAHFNRQRIESVARQMNNAWATAVARWMKSGLNYTKRSPQAGRLAQHMNGKSDRQIAYFFLDALTLHGRGDLERILGILG